MRSRQLAPGEAKDERVSEGFCRPLDGLQRQQGSETPRGEDNSSFWGPTPDCKRLDQGLHGFHADEKGGHAQAALTMNARQPPKSDDACVAGSKQPAAEISGTEGTLTGSESFAGRRFSELGGPLFESLQKYSWTRHSKTQTMAKDALFPLPLGGYPEVPPLFAPWMRAILLGLNSMAGSETGSADSPTEAQKRLVRGLLPFLERVCQFEEQIPSTGFSELFRVKGVDYRGEEIKLATSFNWESIAGALPQEVGSLELAAFCSGGCRHYVDHFEDFLLPPGQQTIGRTPRVLVAPDDWFGVCEGLINTGICGVLPRDQLHHVGDQVLLNGLFAVSKNEFTASGLELQRLIMNLVPLSQLCRSLRGDVGTLPTIAGLSAFYLEDHEVAVMSSEDVKCFYYLFKIPLSWRRFMGFAREVPCDLVPETYKGQPCHLVAQVLPMGFINSVGLAQHIHRNVVRWSRAGLEQLGGGEQELRRDRPAPHSQTLFRVYLDNWDEVRKVDKALCLEVEGKPSVHQLALRQQYSDLELPRHPKKAVESSCVAEVQGALLDGRTGVAYAKPAKLIKYLGLGWELVRSGYASLKELQVVAVGFVYITMFRRPLLCTLNSVWRHMETLKGYPPVVRLAIPREVKLELVRFMALVPLAQMDFRLPMCQQVTASDASSTGGGISCSAGLTSYGQLAQQALVRGEFPEPLETVEILTIGLFDGIGALRVAADVLHLPVAGHVSVECNPAANRVLEAAFPGAIQVNHVQDIDATMVQSWACEFSSVGVVLIGAGPPCQDVSKLNVDRKGSQRGLRSSLYKEIPRVRSLVKKEMPWAQVHLFVESVASMDASDRRAAMSEDLGLVPHQVDAAEISLCRRPRLYWLTWELVDEPGLSLGEEEGSGWTATRHIHLCAEVDQKEFLEAGWFLPPGNRLATFTTSRPSERPGRRPAGLHGCDEASLKRWREDDHRFPPYQYKPEYCVHHPRHPVRVASIIEREAILGFPAGYTEQCVPKQERKSEKASDLRKTLLGNSWSVGVVACLLKQLFERLGVVPHVDVQSLINRLVPGKGTQLQMVLLRPPVRRESQHVYPEDGLARRLTGLVSVKGEDLLLQSSSEGLVKHHRLRSSIPSKLWKWKEVSGWSWRGGAEHINQLEMRAVLTTAKYWVSKKKLQGCKLLHLTDSLVVLHALSRGRSSSRKLRRTIMRINAYLLTANLHPVWTYVHTAQNPADRPSRRVISRKWGKVGSI